MIDLFIVTKLTEDLFFKCIESILSRTSVDILKLVKFHICYTGDDLAQLSRIQGYLSSKNVDFTLIQKEYNFAKCNNEMVRHSTGRYLLFMNDDIELIDDCISHCYQVCSTGKFGTVGCKLLYPDGTIQHAGQELHMTNAGQFIGVTHHLLKQQDQSLPDFVSFGNTGAFLMIERAKFPEFDEGYIICFEDVQLNIEMLAKDYDNVTCCSVSAYHHESKTRHTKSEYLSREDIKKLIEFFNQNSNKILILTQNLERTIKIR